ncbi:MAG: c-type cytochrome [Methylococcaceae bacterium]
MKNIIAGIILSCLSMGSSSMVQAGNAKAGKIAFETCEGCHSHSSYSNIYPTYYVPKLGGQRPSYVVSALKAYRDESRPHASMQGNAYNLTDQKIEDIAAFLTKSTLEPEASPADGSAKAGKVLSASCMGCHAEGKDTGAGYPRLTGQYGNYLVKAMKDYKTGRRKNAIMQSMVKDLSTDDMENLSAYFASQVALSVVEH